MFISGTLIVPLLSNSLEIQKGCSEEKFKKFQEVEIMKTSFLESQANANCSWENGFPIKF